MLNRGSCNCADDSCIVDWAIYYRNLYAHTHERELVLEFTSVSRYTSCNRHDHMTTTGVEKLELNSHWQKLKFKFLNLKGCRMVSKTVPRIQCDQMTWIHNVQIRLDFLARRNRL